MTRAKADSLADYLIESTDQHAAPALLHDRVAEVALAYGLAINVNYAQEIVEPLLDAVRARLLNDRNAAESDGVPWHIELYGSEDEWIRGASFNDESLNPIEKNIRARRAYSATVLTELQALSAFEFERACTTILAYLGCENAHTSPSRDDGGIDFYGQLALKGRLNTALPLGGIDHQVNVWLIGQAKHYPTRAIQTAVILELVGSVELARTKGAIHSWHGLELRPFDAAVMLVFTTGWFSSGSLSLLSQSGVLSMNGKQLAAFLCDAGIGFSDQPALFDAAAFRDELLG